MQERISISLFVALSLASCDYGSSDGNDLYINETKIHLASLGMELSSEINQTHWGSITTKSSFYIWFNEAKKEALFLTLPVYDSDIERLVDGWGEELIIIFADDKLVGIGSKGHNGVWDLGGKDDLVLDLKSMEIRCDFSYTAFGIKE